MNADPPPPIVSLGDLVADVVLTIPQLPVRANKHQLAQNIRVEPGGAGNFLIAGSRLGLPMAALGVLGDDIFGNAVLDTLHRTGIDVNGVIQQPGTNTTTVIVLVDENGGHVFLGEYGVGPELSLPDRWRETARAAGAVFVPGYSLREARLAETVIQTMALAHQNGVPVFFDPGPETAAAGPEKISGVLANSFGILLTDDEIPHLIKGQDGLEGARALLNQGPEMVCVKMGGRGCVILTQDGEVSHPGFNVPVRDTAAAGDSFAAAFIYGTLHGWPWDKIAVFANAMGAAKVQKLGSGTQVPTADEVRAVLEQFAVDLKY
jgi:sugar/nucleoside kinase (ribokinase family)